MRSSKELAQCCLLLLIALELSGQSRSVATIGDSFADSLYNSLHSRPDLIERSNIKLMRWSRPIVGLTRTDVFDYTGWLRDTKDLGFADVCLVEIGSNDMQSIRVAGQWVAYGSPQWREAYGARTREMAQILVGRRCGEVLWVLQPGFEKRDALACHRELINEVQRDVVRLLVRTGVLEVVTNEGVYGQDKTHFNRAFLLQLGPALFQIVDATRQIVPARCSACHGNWEASRMASLAACV